MTTTVGTEQVPLEDLTPFPGNARRGNVELVLDSLRTNGQYKPLVVRRHDGTLTILAGNHTHLALLRHEEDDRAGCRDWELANDRPCQICVEVDADDPTALAHIIECDDATAARINLVDNKSADEGTYDDEALAALLATLDDDLVGTGYAQFSDADLFAETAELEWPSPLDTAEGVEVGESPASDPGGAPRPSLADRFLIPPFDVLDARSGWWRTRKRQWLTLGFRSEVGRDGGLTYRTERADPEFYRRKTAAERELGRTLTAAEFKESYYTQPAEGVGAGTSIFDPVLCELAYRWFSAPGAVVLDPFAGGSVRGLVAGALGRRYYGNDLSGKQVASNREQAEEFAARRLLGPDAAFVAEPGPDDLTPVEEYGGHPVKRDDLFRVGDSAGGKVRTCLTLASRPGLTGLVTAGSRQSPQVNIVATIARRLGLPCRVHVPEAKGPLTPELAAAQDAGAEIVQHRPGYNNVIIARAREDAAERGWAEIPFGMECPEAVEATAAQAANIPSDTRRVVVPVGSGMTLAGVLTGLERAGLTHIPVLGVVVGADPADRLETYAPGWRDRAALVHSDLDYHDHAPVTRLGDLDLDPVYEAKCLPFLEDGDLLWVVGRRGSLAEAGERPVPVWTAGDSTQWVTTLEPESADLVFTCPPYYSLETYSGDPADLSTMDYDAFDETYAGIIAGAAKALRPNRFAVFVVGDARDKRGGLHDLRGSTIRAAQAAGLTYASGGVLLTQVGSARTTAASSFTKTRVLTSTHQDVLVFCKGNRSEAARACGPVDVHLPDELAGVFAASEGEAT